MSQASIPGSGERTPLREQFIVSPLFDAVFFLGSPLIALAAVLGAASLVSDQSVSDAVLLFMAVGHHVPTMLRGYADPEEFRANRYRLLAVPAVLIPVLVLVVLTGSKLLYMVFVWDQYHFVRQHYGFLRLYDVRSKQIEKSRLDLDQWLSFSLFVAIVAHSDFYAYLYSLRLYEMIGPFHAGLGPMLRQASVTFAAVVALGWTVDLLRRLSAGQAVPVLKIALFGSTYGVWWYAYTWLSDPLLSYAISSCFHCLQYDALAWYYNRKKASSLPVSSGAQVFRFLHEGRNLWLYVAAILGYGAFSWVGGMVAPSTIFLLNRTTGLLHYYYDSFIWRVRRPEFRRSLA